MDMIVVGSVALDTVTNPHGTLERGLGGAATYASIAGSYFANPGVVGVVGSDFAQEHIDLLKGRGVDLEGLQVEKDGKTFFWKGRYEGDMGEAITEITELNVFEHFNPRLPETYRKASAVLLANIHPALQLDVLDQVEAPRLTLCDTMNFWISSAPEELEQVFRRVDVICINEDEARQFCNVSTTPAAARELLALGPKRVIVKKGASGAHLYGAETFFAIPALPLTTVKDTTGAGDSFAGGFTGSLAGARELDEAAFRRGVVSGTVMASYAVEDFSCRRTSRLTPAEIQQRVDLLREYTTIPEFKVGQ